MWFRMEKETQFRPVPAPAEKSGIHHTARGIR